MTNTKCICCDADVPPGSIYCPNCLVTVLLAPQPKEVDGNVEEANDNG